MQPTSTHGTHGRSGDPTRPPSPQSQGEEGLPRTQGDQDELSDDAPAEADA